MEGAVSCTNTQKKSPRTNLEAHGDPLQEDKRFLGPLLGCHDSPWTENEIRRPVVNCTHLDRVAVKELNLSHHTVGISRK